MTRLFWVAFSPTSLYFLWQFLAPPAFMSIDQKQVRGVFQKLESDLAKLSSKSQARSVHRFRTGTRRLQILLGELSPQLDRNDKKLLKSLGKIRKRAGKVRDLDVQLTALRSLKIPRQPRRKTQLVNHLIELRRAQEEKLRKEASKTTTREVRRRLKRAEKHYDPESAGDPLALSKAMLDKLTRANDPPNEAVLHQYRILTKRARYAAEFARKSEEANRFIAQLTRLQDALGDWHDWLTLTQTAKRHIGDLHESPLVAELHNVTGAKFRRAIAVLTQSRSKPAAILDTATKVPLSTSGESVSHSASSAA
jgi:CHAD domain-containing protein